MSTQVPSAVTTHIGKKTRIAVAAARFNADLVDELLAGCLRRLSELGVAEDHVEVVRVPLDWVTSVGAACRRSLPGTS